MGCDFQADVASHTVTMTHDLAAHRETVTDALNHSTTYEYDSDGNVVHLIDALSHETFSSYDANDNKLSETDALGYTTQFTYDASNNRTSQTDPLGHVTKWIYDAFGNVLTMENPLHHVTTNTRESGIVCGHASPTGNLLATQDSRGQSTTYAYDCNGNLLSQTDARGGVTTYAYDGAGRLQSTTNALSQASSYTYDANGNQTLRGRCLARPRAGLLRIIRQRKGTAGCQNTPYPTYDLNNVVGGQVGSLYRLHWNGTQFQVNEISIPIMQVYNAYEGLAFARAGAAREPILTTTLQLAGSVTDDGLPKPAQLVSTWTELSGPGAVTFADAHNPQTTATFSDPGKYVLRLTATDGQLTASSDVSIFINPVRSAPRCEIQAACIITATTRTAACGC